VLVASGLALILWSLFRDLGAWIAWVAVLALVWPHRHEGWGARVLQLLVLLGTVWILHKTRNVVYPLLAALLFAYWLHPLVDRLEKRRIPRGVGALAALLPALVVVGLFALFVLPALIEQMGQLIRAIPGVYRSLYESAVPWLQRHLPSSATGEPGVDWWSTISSQWGNLLAGLWGGAQGVTRGVGAVLTVLGMVVLAPILAYYLLADFDRIRAWLIAQIPADRRDQAAGTLQDLEGIVNAYFRGQVLVSVLVGALLTIGFLVIGMPFAVLLGFLGGLLNLVPVLGFWISVVIFLPAAILSGEPGSMLFRLAIVIAVQSVIESQVLTPRIVGRAVGLNPAVILVAVLAFGALMGPVGVVIAVPAAAMIRTLLQRRLARLSR
jgi:predicted PurR-regulated permease PerM